MDDTRVLSYATPDVANPRNWVRWLSIVGMVAGSLSLGVSVTAAAGSIGEYQHAKSVVYPWRTTVRVANRVLVPNPTRLSRAAFVAFLVHLAISSALAVLLIWAASLALANRAGTVAHFRWYAWAKLASLPYGLLAALWFKGNLRAIFQEHFLTTGSLFKLVFYGPEAILVAVLAAAFPVVILVVLRKPRSGLGLRVVD